MNNVSKISMDCVGCRSCEQICPKKCIKMSQNSEGFLYPKIDEEKCINCGICLFHCPMKSKNVILNTPLLTYGAKNKNKERIINSASGGVSDLIAQYIISINGFVFGCAYTNNLEAKHILIDKKEDLYKIQSSKYVQSDIGKCYKNAKKLLEEDNYVLFTGTPCQIAGLYAFLGKKYDKLYTLDLICHGVPSPLFLKKYLEYMSKKLNEKITFINFRFKGKRGWGTQEMIQTKTKTKTKTLKLDKYGYHFMSGDCYRECCYSCKFCNIHRVGDITIGDFWGILSCNPEFFSESGVSSVIVNTEKGKELIKHISKETDLISCNLEDILIKQGNLKKPTNRTNKRDNFYNDIQKDYFIKNIKINFQLKERIKSVIPIYVLNKIKSILKLGNKNF